jgi:hypothetical protein
MPYVRRNNLGEIVSLYQADILDGLEFLPSDHADVQAFLGSDGLLHEDFARLDADFVRVLEDLIDTLIGKNLINITDLPAQAQAKLLSRKGFRERSSPRPLQLFGEMQLDALVSEKPHNSSI